MSDLNQLRMMPRNIVIWRGLTFLITNSKGWIGTGEEGFYYRQTRFLSKLRLAAGGNELRSISANPTASDAAIAYYSTPSPAGGQAGPEPEQGGDGGEIVKRGIEVQINTALAGGLRLDVHVTNRTLAPADVTLNWELAADFADLAEVTSEGREQDAPVERCWEAKGGGGELSFRYRHPKLDHASRIRLSGPGRFYVGGGDEAGALCWSLHLVPQQEARLAIEVELIFCGEKMVPPETASCPTMLRLTAANPVVQQAWDRAAADLASLPLIEGDGIERRTPAAGIPKYTALFGRDSLITGFQAGILDPAMLSGAVRLISKWNATVYDDRYDAQPGRVIHQHQMSPLALLRKNPFLHYYGDYSAPGWFLIDSAWSLALTGDRQAYLSLRDKILETLAWMDRDGDADRDGFYEYETKAGDRGEKNQGWKDSRQAILYPDGRLVPDPIALVEIQGCYYAAKQLTALAFSEIGEHSRAAELLDQAAALKRRFNAGFWLDDIGYFALALDPAKNPVATVAPDPGQCLAYGIIDDEKAAAVADRLMDAELFTGWGLRTLSNRHPAFNPFAYHLGSVWPAMNALIAFGLKRYGFNGHLHRLAKAMFDATRLFELGRLPEALGGQPRDPLHPHPGIYPEANSPQAWSASAVILLVHAMLGLLPLAPRRTLIVDPDLPEWLSELTLRDIAVGNARISLRFRRDGDGRTGHEVLSGDGSLRVCRAPGDAVAGTDRFARLLQDFIGTPSAPTRSHS